MAYHAYFPLVRKLDSMRFLCVFLVGVVLFLAIPAICIFYLDPYRFFRAGLDDPRGGAVQEYFRIAGKIKRLDYQTCAFGTSLTEMLHKNYVEEELGWSNFENFSLPGALPYEQKIVAQFAFERGQCARVLWGIHQALFTEHSPDNFRSVFPRYAYTSNWADDYPYVFSYDVFKRALSGYTGNLDLPENTKAPTFQSEPQAANQGSVYDFRPTVKDTVLAIIKEHPDVEFKLIFPPINGGMFARNRKVFADYLELRHFLAKSVQQFPNAKLYDFQDEFEYSNDPVRYYYDLQHFKEPVARYILGKMKKGQKELSPENVEAVNRRLAANVAMLAELDRRGILPEPGIYPKPQPE